MSIYGARTVNGRERRTKAEIAELRDALYEIVAEHAPTTVRGAFYLATTQRLRDQPLAGPLLTASSETAKLAKG